MSRNEFSHRTIESNIEGDRDKTKELSEENEKHIKDLETERHTLDSLEGGTVEGLEDCIDNINEAQGISSDEFDEGTSGVNEAHEEIDEHQEQIDEGKERAESDLEMIGEARSEVNSEKVSDSLETAEESVQYDIEFLEQCDAEEEQIEQESHEFNQQQQERARTALGE